MIRTVRAVLKTLICSMFLGALAGRTGSPATSPPEGLALELTVPVKGPVLPGERFPFTVTLVNRSKTSTHRVIIPGDGSEAGLREPHVFWSVTFVGVDGIERPVNARGVGRCGIYAEEWWKDATSLAPETSSVINGFVHPFSVYSILEDGTVRLRAHYAWKGGVGRRKTSPEDLGGMKGVEPYELVSNVVEVSLRARLGIVVKPKARFVAGVEVKVADVVDARLESRTAVATTVEPATCWLNVVYDSSMTTAWSNVNVYVEPPKAGRPFELQPHSSVPLLREGPFGEGRDPVFKFEKPGKARFAILMQSGPSGESVQSNWVEVDVGK
jgi:hypothetical protein